MTALGTGGKGRNRFPEGMPERKAGATAKPGPARTAELGVRLVDDVEAVEEDDDGEAEEHDADRDAIAEAALFGGGGKAALLGIGRRAAAGLAGVAA